MKVWVLALVMFGIGVAMFHAPKTASAVTLTNNICSDAQGSIGNPGTPTACEKRGGLAESTLLGTDGIVTQIIRIILFVVGIASVVMIIIGGLRYILSAGDSNGIQGAKNTILYALVGLVIAVSSQIIVSFVINRL